MSSCLRRSKATCLFLLAFGTANKIGTIKAMKPFQTIMQSVQMQFGDRRAHSAMAVAAAAAAATAQIISLVRMALPPCFVSTNASEGEEAGEPERLPAARSPTGRARLPRSICQEAEHLVQEGLPRGSCPESNRQLRFIPAATPGSLQRQPHTEHFPVVQPVSYKSGHLSCLHFLKSYSMFSETPRLKGVLLRTRSVSCPYLQSSSEEPRGP